MSGQDAEGRVQETGVIKRLYAVRGKEVADSKFDALPELQEQKEIETSKLNGKGLDTHKLNGKEPDIQKEAEHVEGSSSDGKA